MLERYFERMRERRALRICLKEFDRYRYNKPPSLLRGRWL